MNKKNLPSTGDILTMLILFALVYSMWGEQLDRDHSFAWMNDVFGPMTLLVFCIGACVVSFAVIAAVMWFLTEYNDWRDR